MSLDEYIHSQILPRYAAFDKGHQRDHADAVIAESLKLAKEHGADERMALVIAAYHDLGLAVDRESHHIHSGEILLADRRLREWFTEEQLLIMRDAVEDHRASSKRPPRTIYGAIVAEADRQLEPETIIRRALFFGLQEKPDADFDWLFERAYVHLVEKYGENGYMKLWLQSERNVRALQTIRAMLQDKEQLREFSRKLLV